MKHVSVIRSPVLLYAGTVETNHTIPETPIFKTLGLVYLSYRQSK